MPNEKNLESEIVDLVRAKLGSMTRSLFLGIDGRSGAGKSTLAAQLVGSLDAALIEGDDFYAGGTEIRTDSPASRATACIDWTRQRSVLETLASGRNANWRAFDWEAFDGRLCIVPTEVEPKSVVILEGAYACRPELSDLLDLRILLTAPDHLRRERLLAREGSIGLWETQWHQAEDHYFSSIMPETAFDVVIRSFVDRA